MITKISISKPMLRNLTNYERVKKITLTQGSKSVKFFEPAYMSNKDIKSLIVHSNLRIV